MAEAPSRMEKNEAPRSTPVVQGTRRLRPRDITFGDTIEEMGGLLNFYMETWFNVDEVFGTHVCTDENDDTLNVYANYDIASGQVRSELELTLCCGDGEDIPLVYRLDEDERAALLEQMRDYCQKETGQSLEDYAASLRMEDAACPQMTM